MSKPFDPRELGAFKDEEQLIDYLLERVVRPRLKDALGPGVDAAQIPGKVVVFGGRDGVRLEAIAKLQRHLQRGVPLDYVLGELTALKVRRQSESRRGALLVQYVELGGRTGEPAPWTARELQARFEAS